MYRVRLAKSCLRGFRSDFQYLSTRLKRLRLRPYIWTNVLILADKSLGPGRSNAACYDVLRIVCTVYTYGRLRVTYLQVENCQRTPRSSYRIFCVVSCYVLISTRRFLASCNSQFDAKLTYNSTVWFDYSRKTREFREIGLEILNYQKYPLSQNSCDTHIGTNADRAWLPRALFDWS